MQFGKTLGAGIVLAAVGFSAVGAGFASAATGVDDAALAGQHVQVSAVAAAKQPDSSKIPALTEDEREAVQNKQAGLPYDHEAYQSALHKVQQAHQPRGMAARQIAPGNTQTPGSPKTQEGTKTPDSSKAPHSTKAPGTSKKKAPKKGKKSSSTHSGTKRGSAE